MIVCIVYFAVEVHSSKTSYVQDEEEHQQLQEQLYNMERAVAEREQQASPSHTARSYRLHVQKHLQHAFLTHDKSVFSM